MKEYWEFDGVRLSNPWSDVKSRSAGWGIPSKDGDNQKNPNSEGTTWQPHKPYTQKIIPLDMWVTGLTAPGDLTSMRAACKSRVDAFNLLFGRSGDLYRLERKHYMDGATNRVTNPRLVDTTTVNVPTGITKLGSANYTATAAGYIGFELPKGSTTTLTIAGKVYTYTDISRAIAGWVHLNAGDVVSGTLSGGANVYFYNPATANHTQVSHMFPLPQAVAQWTRTSWSSGNVLARTEDGSGSLVLVTAAGGKYVYPITGEAVVPEEPIDHFYVSGTLAPAYIAETSSHFPSDLVLDSIPDKLFPGVIFTDSSCAWFASPRGNLIFVPTDRGYVLPASGTSLTYNTSDWYYTGSTKWGIDFLSSGSVLYTGVEPEATIDPLGVGDTIHAGFAWHDAAFQGQTVKVTLHNRLSHIVSPTLVRAVGVYTHLSPLKLFPEFKDGDSPDAIWVGTPNNSETSVYTSRWIEAECPTDGVQFSSQAGGTRSEFTVNLVAPGVYWRDNDDLDIVYSWKQTPFQSGQDFEWELTQFSGATAPLGGVQLEIASVCTQPNWDVDLEIYDVSSRRTTAVKIPVNQTWLLDSDKFLFYQIAPSLSIDRFASFERVAKSSGGSLVHIQPIAQGHPILRFRTPQYASATIDFTVRVRGYRRYLSA